MSKLDMNSVITPREVDRIARTVAAVPSDATSCLEVGFLDLRVTEKLAEKVDVVSVDLPREVRDRKSYRLAFADIQRLPFRDRAFDLAFCTEVLEHLPQDVLSQGCNELQRVTSKYLLVTVPFRQRVWNELFRCRYCGQESNTMGHLHYLDQQKLDSFFPEMQIVGRQLMGELLGYAPDWLYAAGRNFGRVWHTEVSDCAAGACPNCLRSNAAVEPNLAGMLVQRITWRVERLMPPRPAWLLALYQRKR
jgi:hypothetical protein